MPRGAVTVNELRMRADTLAYGGDAVGRLASGKVCFASGGLPGEELELRVVQEKSAFVRAEVVKVLTRAPERIEVDCPAFTEHKCPGCAYIFCDYRCELEWKNRQFSDFLCRAGLLEHGELLEPFSAGERFGYRNKLKLHSDGKGNFGMVGRDNETIFPVKECLLARAEINAAISGTPVPEAGRCVTWRYSSADAKVTAFGDGAKLKNSNWLTEEIPGFGKFKVPQDGFFQTNINVAAELVRRVVGTVAASGAEQMVELYCGVGVFSIAAAGNIPHLKVTATEIVPGAIKAARWNAGKHGVGERCSFFAGDAGKLSARQKAAPGSLVLVDPPRGGLSRQTIEAVIAMKPAKIVYVSCAPDTLRRDLLIFQKAGWYVENAGMLDMFPGTAHFESMVTLKKM